MSINLRALKDVDEDAEIVRNEIASLDTEIKTLRSVLKVMEENLSSTDRQRKSIKAVLDSINGEIQDCLDLGEILNDRRWELVQEQLAILGAAFAKGAIE